MEIKKVQSIKKKVIIYYEDIGALTGARYNPALYQSIIHEGIIYYIQVGENVLDDDIKKRRLEHYE